MKTISSLRKDEEDSNESSDDEGQAFYAGGSEARLEFHSAPFYCRYWI